MGTSWTELASSAGQAHGEQTPRSAWSNGAWAGSSQLYESLVFLEAVHMALIWNEVSWLADFLSMFDNLTHRLFKGASLGKIEVETANVHQLEVN